MVTLAGLLTWQGALLYVLGDTGTINITNSKITGLANTFYSDTVGWIMAVVAIGGYAASTCGRGASAWAPASPTASCRAADPDRAWSRPP